ncbi:helix-turn-helix domain-containing protein [Streptomyces sp. NPDC086023]|uniref:helix-turn-helix domain-containing protein n=1 Tax=Streptomyces sp. NPDC086023 TaxID=3365746 RepID=UPI0037D061FC
MPSTDPRPRRPETATGRLAAGHQATGQRAGDEAHPGPGPGGEGTPVALAALLGDQGLGLRHAAGGTGAEVYGVHASEMADPSPYLLGGELLLTAGQELGPGPGAYAGYVARLAAAGVAALGFGVAPVHEVVPEGLVRACAEQGLPLVEVPAGTPFTAVARAVWRLMAEARTRELRRVTEAQQALASAAARPDPVPSVLRRLSATLDGWSAVYLPEGPQPAGTGTPEPPGVPGTRGGAGVPAGPGPGPGVSALPDASGTAGSPGGAPAASGFRPGGGRYGRAVHGAGNVPGDEVVAALEVLVARVASGAVATAGETVAGAHLAAYALGSPGGAGSAAPEARTGRGAGAPRAVLAIASPRRRAGDHTIAGVAAVLLTLLTARPATGGAEAAALVRLLLGASAADALGPGARTVVHAHGAGDPAALARALGTALYAADGPYVRLLTDQPPAPQPGWRLGVSAPAGPDALAVAEAQAARALERAESARTPLARHTDTGLAGLVGAAEARAHAEALLGPLSPALRDTLRGWLAHHGSWDRTAAALGVHRNTVRQRVSRAAALLGRDLDDADTRMELWFALRTASGVGGHLEAGARDAGGADGAGSP